MPDSLTLNRPVVLRDTVSTDTAAAPMVSQKLLVPEVASPQVMDFAGLLAAGDTLLGEHDSITLPLVKLEESLLPDVPGVVGTPIPYNFKTDNYLAGILVLCLVLMMWFVSRSQHYITFCLKSFFRRRGVANERNERAENELHGQILVFGQLCLALGLLYYDFLQEMYPALRHAIAEKPYIIIGATAGMMLMYGCVKALLYTVVNHVFFSKEQCAEWWETYINSVVVTGVLLFPVTLLVVYLDMTFSTQLFLFLGIIGVVKAVLLFRCIHTFFNGLGGLLHLILYFCTLEIVPALFLWRVLFWTNTNLAITI